MRIILLGNAGAGKSTMATQLAAQHPGIPQLSLDQIAWQAGPERKTLAASRRELQQFIDRHERWIIEGCYGDLIEAALPFCTELRFLNPGVAVCLEHCRRRPWEPAKFPTPEAQHAMLETLLAWVSRYETRDDEYGLQRHKQIFHRFPGSKQEYAQSDL